MKKQTKIILLLNLISFISVVIALCFLPPEIPLHIGFGGFENIASKYFLFILVPVPSLIYWGIQRKYKN